MTDMPTVGFLCAGKSPLALSVSIHCAYKMTQILKEGGFSVGAYHTEITEPLGRNTAERAENTFVHICKCCDLVVTVGCTGFAVSDIMPDITERVCTKSVSYFSALLCGSKSVFNDESQDMPGNMHYGKSACFCPSRATAGIIDATLVLNFPENINYATSLLTYLMPAIGFTVYNLSGKSARNSAEFKKIINSSLTFNEVFKKECIVNL